MLLLNNRAIIVLKLVMQMHSKTEKQNGLLLRSFYNLHKFSLDTVFKGPKYLKRK